VLNADVPNCYITL